MLSGLARTLLVATSLAPVLLVYAAALVDDRPVWTVALVAAAALLVVLCLLVLAFLRSPRGPERVAVEVCSVSPKDSDYVAFLVAYLLPILQGRMLATNFWAVATFALVAFVVLLRANVVHVNPLLGLLGYHFYEVESSAKLKLLWITPSKEPPALGKQEAKPLGPTLYLAS